MTGLSGGNGSPVKWNLFSKLTSGQLMYVLYHENDGLQGALSLYFHKLLSVFFYKILIFFDLESIGYLAGFFASGIPSFPLTSVV